MRREEPDLQRVCFRSQKFRWSSSLARRGQASGQVSFLPQLLASKQVELPKEERQTNSLRRADHEGGVDAGDHVIVHIDVSTGVSAKRHLPANIVSM